MNVSKNNFLLNVTLLSLKARLTLLFCFIYSKIVKKKRERVEIKK